MKILPIDFTSPNASQNLSTSLHETGFAILSNHPLLWDEIEESYKEWEVFFNSDAKYKYHFNPETQDGYLPKTHEHQAANSKISVRDIKEVFQLYFPWGRYPEEISDLSRNLFYKKFKLGKTLLNWLEENLPIKIKDGLKKNLSEMACIERTLYRAIHYPPLSENEEPGAIRAAAHTDFSLLTLLPAATAPGLQVQDNHGNWHEVNVDPNTIIVNVGGTLQEATNYYYKSTMHQVVNPYGKETAYPRLSLPLFLHGDRDIYLSERYPTVGDYFDTEIEKLSLGKRLTY